jgi:hypothetical protein
MKWESVTYGSLAGGLGEGILKFAITDGIPLLIPGGKATKVMKIVSAAGTMKSLVHDAIASKIDDRFTYAIKKARQAGKMLGIALSLGFPFSSQTVSLVGFSLGTQVIKSCLKML